jgi:Zn finger protein HypA/HybF involved in hydrogenase expression
MNNRIYSKEIYSIELEKLKESLIQLYCEDCFEPWEPGETNLSRIDKSCEHCGSESAPGVSLKRMRELKLRKLVDE